MEKIILILFIGILSFSVFNVVAISDNEQLVLVKNDVILDARRLEKAIIKMSEISGSGLRLMAIWIAHPQNPVDVPT